jgi:hypothetical protein
MTDPQTPGEDHVPVTNVRRVNSIFRKPAGMMPAMAASTRGRPSLGERAIVTATLPVSVRRVAEHRATDHHLNLSPYLADVICYHYGRADLMRNLRQSTVFDAGAHVSDLTFDVIGKHVTIRLPLPVAHEVECEVGDRDVERSTLLADIVCLHLGFPGLIRALDKEVLPLAI